ncbi:hypothetical protein D3C87_1556680 [compost metagenome]
MPNPTIRISMTKAFTGILNPFFLSVTNTYRQGNTNSVKNVAEIKPPITTVANGLCTSAPALPERAIGKKPREATEAVIITGLNLTAVPCITRL